MNSSENDCTHGVSLVETIRVTDGTFRHLPLHIDRMRRSCLELYGTPPPALRLTERDVPPDLRQGDVKCRVVYSTDIVSIAYTRYTPRTIRTLRTVTDDSADYHLKFSDRSRLETLAARKGEADEILIVRNGLVTDTSFSNILCVCGDMWLTPAQPLLRGVMRQRLIEEGRAIEADITPDMLRAGNRAGITAVILINAMLPPGKIPPIPLTRIIQ
ncbi:MAG: aminotransferase class IV [Muribaculaceae bacterium]|nr:aminotransferase class IV [Muribaculaceae bacterium]